MSRLFLEFEPGDHFQIGDTTIHFETKSGRKIRVRIETENQGEASPVEWSKIPMLARPRLPS